MKYLLVIAAWFVGAYAQGVFLMSAPLVAVVLGIYFGKFEANMKMAQFMENNEKLRRAFVDAVEQQWKK